MKLQNSHLLTVIFGTAIFANAQTINVTEGWQLVGAINEIKDFSVFSSECVTKIYSFKNGMEGYKSYTPSLSSGEITNLSAGDGFWIKASKTCSLNLTPTQDQNSTTSSDANESSNTTSSTETSCTGESDIALAVCAAETFLKTLSDAEKSSATYDWSDTIAKTRWINLPVDGHPRSGISFNKMSDESIAAALKLAQIVLSSAGYEDFTGIRAADDYIGAMRSSGGGTGVSGGPTANTKATDVSSGYSSELYSVAIIGTPSVNGDWMVMLGGHHMAYNITFVEGVGYPTPHHAGAEPKTSFEIESATYAPLKDEGDAMVAIFDSLDSSQLSSAYLSGETYSDVLVGPEYELGYNDTSRYPTTNRGLSVSKLSDTQKAKVVASIKQWVNDYTGAISDPLLATYTSEDALNNTYVAWAGNENTGVNVDVSGTYMRIDGPRLWIEIACQNGVVISNQTHYHAMFRDKTMDYGGSL